MNIKGFKTIKRFPDGTGIAEGFEFEIDADSFKQFMRAAAIEIMLTNTGVGELIAAAETVLSYRGLIGEYPGSIALEPLERIPLSALDRLAEAVKNVREGEASNPENSERSN